jgi:3-deoxy-manno-octulosonate cytidylyltransferase (CMP-KDO synthetase)
MSVTVIIPARLASTRLPNKPLVDLCGKPLIQRVFEQVSKAKVDRIIMAVDDEKVATVAKNFGAETCMTRIDHHSGTDRIAEVVEDFNIPDDEIIVNVQCDEPFVPAENIQLLVDTIRNHDHADIATLCESLEEKEDVFNPHFVKVVKDKNDKALYFSRATIPWHRDTFAKDTFSSDGFYLHIGLYAYRAGFVKRFVQWPPAPIEKLEALEQLRALWNGASIYVAQTELSCGIGINTPEDLEKAKHLV